MHRSCTVGAYVCGLPRAMQFGNRSSHRMMACISQSSMPDVPCQQATQHMLMVTSAAPADASYHGHDCQDAAESHPVCWLPCARTTLATGAPTQNIWDSPDKPCWLSSGQQQGSGTSSPPPPPAAVKSKTPYQMTLARWSSRSETVK